MDVGFVDEGRLEARLARGEWLHDAIRAVASETIGIDADEPGVDAARAHGAEAYTANCESRDALEALGLEPAELVVAGELLEHLDRPGDFLDAAHVLVADGGRLVLTTPNAHALTNVLAGLLGRELVNADHVAWFSWRTLTTLLARHGWRPVEIAFYPFPRTASPSALETAVFRAYQFVARPLFRARPGLADGIVVVAERA